MSLQSPHQDYFLTREILFTHDPDDRWLDSDLLLNIVESVFCCTAAENVSDPPQLDVIFGIGEIDLIKSEEPISHIIHKISNEIICLRFDNENLHRKTIFLLEMLSRYRWDAKLVLALASFAANFGVFWLILLLQSDNALADSLAIVKQLPNAIHVLKPQLKALNSLVDTMLKLTKLVIRFEGMSLQHELVDDNAMDITKSKIYIATYWIFRSILICSRQISAFRNSKLEYSDKTVIAAWELLSLRKKLNSFSHDLVEHVGKCQHQIETRLYEKLLRVFKENEVDNQNGLRTLLASENEFPLKNPSSGEKCGILDLINKVVILLISKPEFLPIDKIFFLVHRMTRKTDGNYEIVWLSIPSTCKWSPDDNASFEFLSNRLPWFSIRRPWTINPTVINYIKQEWGFEEDPMMVVLNENGVVINSNAMDMVWIWGSKAFPFSTSREKELWENENWTLNFMINGINSLLSEWVEEDKNLCIYGGDNLDWIREFSSETTKIKSIVGIQFEAVYVGCKNSGENVKDIIDTIYQENLSTSLTFNKVHLFWFRLETIKRSIGNQVRTTSSDKIAEEVAKLLDSNINFGWAVIGRGSCSTDMMKLDREGVEELFDKFPFWCKNVEEMGLVGAIRSVIEPTLGGGKCCHDELVAYEEGLMKKSVFCGSCKRTINKFVVYKCDE